jgi:histone deacetylase 6
MVHEPELWKLHCCRGHPTAETAGFLRQCHGGRSAIAPPERLQFVPDEGGFNAVTGEAGQRSNPGVSGLVEAEGLVALCQRLPVAACPPVGSAELKRHGGAHLAAIDAAATDGPPVPPDAPCQRCNYTLLPTTPDRETWLCQHSPAVMKRAVGGMLGLVDEVLTKRAAHGVMMGGACGHHAHAERASGYGHYNEMVVAADRATERHGVSRVMIFDWDVHCGDGIEAMLYANPKVLYCSTHRYDDGKFFPAGHYAPRDCGDAGAVGLTVNIAWGQGGEARASHGMGDEEYRAAFEAVVEPLARAWQPELLLVFGGMDAAEGDPVGQCNLSPAMYGWMTTRLMAMVAPAPVVVLLTGGYDIHTNKPGPSEAVRAMLGKGSGGSFHSEGAKHHRSLFCFGIFSSRSVPLRRAAALPRPAAVWRRGGQADRQRIHGPRQRAAGAPAAALRRLARRLLRRTPGLVRPARRLPRRAGRSCGVAT